MTADIDISLAPMDSLMVDVITDNVGDTYVSKTGLVLGGRRIFSPLY